MLQYRICHICGNKMFPAIKDFVYQHKNKEVVVRNINCFKCSCCNEVIYAAEEAKRIEAAVMSK